MYGRFLDPNYSSSDDEDTDASLLAPKALATQTRSPKTWEEWIIPYLLMLTNFDPKRIFSGRSNTVRQATTGSGSKSKSIFHSLKRTSSLPITMAMAREDLIDPEFRTLMIQDASALREAFQQQKHDSFLLDFTKRMHGVLTQNTSWKNTELFKQKLQTRSANQLIKEIAYSYLFSAISQYTQFHQLTEIKDLHDHHIYVLNQAIADYFVPSQTPHNKLEAINWVTIHGLISGLMAKQDLSAEIRNELRYINTYLRNLDKGDAVLGFVNLLAFLNEAIYRLRPNKAIPDWVELLVLKANILKMHEDAVSGITVAGKHVIDAEYDLDVFLKRVSEDCHEQPKLFVVAYWDSLLANPLIEKEFNKRFDAAAALVVAKLQQSALLDTAPLAAWIDATENALLVNLKPFIPIAFLLKQLHEQHCLDIAYQVAENVHKTLYERALKQTFFVEQHKREFLKIVLALSLVFPNKEMKLAFLAQVNGLPLVGLRKLLSQTKRSKSMRWFTDCSELVKSGSQEISVSYNKKPLFKDVDEVTQIVLPKPK